LDGNKVERNLAYYVVAHASAAVPAGSLRIRSTAPDDPAGFLFEDEQGPGVMRFMKYDRAGVLPNVAFRTPDGRVVLVVTNTSSSAQRVKIQYNGQFVDVQLPAGAVGTYEWIL
jgi:glucosylceramidase